MKKVNIRVKEICNPKDKNEVFITLFAILDELGCYSHEIFEGLIEENYRIPTSIESKEDVYISHLKKIVRENKCDDLDSLLNMLFIIKQKLVYDGLSENYFEYDVEENDVSSLLVSIAVFA